MGGCWAANKTTHNASIKSWTRGRAPQEAGRVNCWLLLPFCVTRCIDFLKESSHSIHNLLLLTSLLPMNGLPLGRQTMLTPWTGPADSRAHCAGEGWEDGPTSGSPTPLSTGRHCVRWGLVDLLRRSDSQHSPPQPPPPPSFPPSPHQEWLPLTLALTRPHLHQEKEGKERRLGKERGREGGRPGRKSREWHRNITMHLEARLANTAGLGNSGAFNES